MLKSCLNLMIGKKVLINWVYTRVSDSLKLEKVLINQKASLIRDLYISIYYRGK
jgi:hypothetical protein